MKTRIYLFFIMLFVFISCSGTVSVLADTQAKFNVSDIPAGNILIYNGWFLASNTYFRGTYDGGQIVIADTYWLSNDGINWTEHSDTPKILEAADCVVVLGTIKTSGKLDSYHFGSLDGVIDGYSYPLIPFDLPTGVLQTETVYFLYNNSLFCAVPKYHNQELSVHTTYISSNEQFLLYAYDSYTWSLRSSSLLQMNLNSVVYCNGVSVDGYFSVQSLMQSSTAAPSPTPTLSPTPIPSSGDYEWNHVILNISQATYPSTLITRLEFDAYGFSVYPCILSDSVKEYFSLSDSVFNGVVGSFYDFYIMFTALDVKNLFVTTNGSGPFSSSISDFSSDFTFSGPLCKVQDCLYVTSSLNRSNYNSYKIDGVSFSIPRSDGLRFNGSLVSMQAILYSDIVFLSNNNIVPLPTPTPFQYSPTDSPVPSNVPVPVVTQAINLEIPDDVDFSKVGDEFNKMGLYTGWLVAFRMLPDEVQVFFWIAICVGCLWLILRALR